MKIDNPKRDATLMVAKIRSRFQRLSSTSGKSAIGLLVIGLIVIASLIRIQAYGNIDLSIAGNDTASYVEASQVPLFSREMLTGRRLLTTNLLYKIFEPKEGYHILLNGSIQTAKRIVQPGFTNIVITQLAFSILGWGLLALIVSGNIKNPLMKILSALIVLLFAFTPQVADWDSILMSESLAFSLFALQLAILIKIVFSIYEGESSKLSILICLWSITYFFWTFLRDTNLFTSFVTIGMVVICLISFKYRRNKYLYGILIVLALSLGLGLATASKSTRSIVQMTNVYRDDLLHNPLNISTLRELGMPPPESTEFQAWFAENSGITLIKFMFIHPGYPALKIKKDFPESFREIKQTYFKAPDLSPTRDLLMTIGDALHPENTTPFLLDVMLLLGLLLLAVINSDGPSRPWAWLGTWLFLTATLTLIPTILGDTWALNRHTLFSSTIFRLFMWVFSIVIMDIALNPNLHNGTLTVEE